MSEVKLLVTMSVPPDLLKDIAELDRRVQMATLTDAQRALLLAGQGDKDDPEAAALRALLQEAEIVFCGYEVRRSADLIGRAPNLRWLHTVAAGVEDLLQAGLGKGSYVFTNGSGPHAISMGEFVLLQMLMLAKAAPRFLRNQIAGKWERVYGIELYGTTVGIVGLGDIGMAVAERAKPFGCRVLATRRSVQAKQVNVGPVDELLPPSELPYLLQESDFVVLAVPLTKETYHLLNAAMLRRMKPTAYLINVARGAVVDEAALIEALRSGSIAGAALDVFEQEPLPPESPLWGMENVIITPHISPNPYSEPFQRRQVDLFKENLRRYLAGEPLLNVVDVERGY